MMRLRSWLGTGAWLPVVLLSLGWSALGHADGPPEYDVGTESAADRPRHSRATLADDACASPCWFEAALSAPDPRHRRQAVSALRDLRSAAGVPVFLAAMTDADPAVREEAIGALRWSGVVAAVEPMIARLTDEHEHVRSAAARALGELGDSRAVEPLIDRFMDENETPLVRADSESAARMLTRINRQPLAPWMTLLNSAHAHGRAAAARALGESGDTRAVEALIVRLEDQQPAVRAAAARALGELGDGRAVEPLIARLNDADHETRQAVTEALGVLGDIRAVEPLIARLDDVNGWVRVTAATALGHLGDARALEPLRARLDDAGMDDEEISVRGVAAIALGRWGDLSALEPLIAIAQPSHHDVDTAWVLHHLDDTAHALETLVDRFTREDLQDHFHASAVELLGIMGGPRAVEPLLLRLHDENDRVRRDAAWALGALGDARAVTPLIERLDDEARWVRRTAAEALGALGDTRAVEPLIARLNDADHAMRQAVAEALGALGDARAVAPLIERLTDADRLVRLAVAEALGALGDTRAVEPLIARLEDDDSSVRSAAVRSLSRLDGLNVARLKTRIPGQSRTRLYPLLSDAPRYGSSVLPLIHHATHHAVYGHQLEILGLLRGWEGERAVVSADTLAADLAALRDPASPAGADPEAVDANPYVALFLARLHQENGRHAEALDRAEHGLRHAPESHTALRIVLGWLRAEALWRLDRPEEALAILRTIETERLPRLALIEYHRTGLAFDAYTGLLQGLLLQELDRDADATLDSNNAR